MRPIHRPADEDVPEFYRGYIAAMEGDDLLKALKSAKEALWDVLYAMPAGHEHHRYAPGKWSVLDVIQHLLDAERVFSYRALRFARGDDTPLPGFDEDRYAEAAGASERKLHQVMREHDALRASTIELFRGFSDAQLDRRGVANGKVISVRALGWATAGHVMHHVKVLRERYLPSHAQP